MVEREYDGGRAGEGRVGPGRRQGHRMGSAVDWVQGGWVAGRVTDRLHPGRELQGAHLEGRLHLDAPLGRLGRDLRDLRDLHLGDAVHLGRRLLGK